MNCQDIDLVLVKTLPKDITKIIFNYYTNICLTCNYIQTCCENCKIYNCMCVVDKKCNICPLMLCKCECVMFIKICVCCESYLCNTCWNDNN